MGDNGKNSDKMSYEEMKRKGLLSSQIQGFFNNEISRMTKTVGHSRKGKPQRKAWGMHIEGGVR